MPCCALLLLGSISLMMGELDSPRDPLLQWSHLDDGPSLDFARDGQDSSDREGDIELPSRVEDMHRRIGKRVLDLSDRIDDFFGDPRLELDAGKTRFRVRSELNLYDSGESKIRVRVRAHAVLPRTQHRVGLFLESFRDDVLNDFDDLFGDPAEDEGSPFESEQVSGVRAALFSNMRGKLTLDGGVKLAEKPQTRIRLRWKEDHELGDLWSLRVIQGLEYRGEEGYGERTQLRFERSVDEKLLRFGIEGVWFKEQHYSLLLSTSYFLPIGSRTVVRFNGDMTGVLGEDPARTGVGLGVAVRRRLYSDWLFVEVSPRLFWPDKSLNGSELSWLLVSEVIFGR